MLAFGSPCEAIPSMTAGQLRQRVDDLRGWEEHRRAHFHRLAGLPGDGPFEEHRALRRLLAQAPDGLHASLATFSLLAARVAAARPGPHSP